MASGIPHLMVVTREEPPYVMVKCRNCTGNERYEGFAIDLLHAISEVSFTNLCKDMEYGNGDDLSCCFVMLSTAITHNGGPFLTLLDRCQVLTNVSPRLQNSLIHSTLSLTICMVSMITRERSGMELLENLLIGKQTLL